MALQDIRTPSLGQALRPNVWDIVALVLVIGAMVLIVYGGEQTVLPLSSLDVAPVSLDPVHLPLYALRTTLRMLLAIVCSIIFTFIYAALAAKSRRAEMVLIPLLDILTMLAVIIAYDQLLFLPGGGMQTGKSLVRHIASRAMTDRPPCYRQGTSRILDDIAQFQALNVGSVPSVDVFVESVA